MTYRQSKGDDLFRRSLYTIWKRTVAPPSLAILDAADRESCLVTPKRTNTPLQALVLLNELTFVESARNLAEKMLTDGKGEPVTWAFRTVTSRRPKPEELALLQQTVEEFQEHFTAHPAAAKQLVSHGESKRDKTLDPVEMAAYTTLANVLLNLDEVVTKK